jgi:hypothetical protein
MLGQIKGSGASAWRLRIIVISLILGLGRMRTPEEKIGYTNGRCNISILDAFILGAKSNSGL